MAAKIDGPGFGKVVWRAYEQTDSVAGKVIPLLLVWVLLLVSDGLALEQPTGHLTDRERAVSRNIGPQRQGTHGDQPDQRQRPIGRNIGPQRQGTYGDQPGQRRAPVQYQPPPESATIPLQAQLAAAPIRAHPGESVELAVKVTPSQQGAIQYSFEFGDGTSSAWTQAPRVRHVYARAGTYHVSALVRSDHPQPRALVFNQGPTRTNEVRIEIVSPVPPQLVLSVQPPTTRTESPVEPPIPPPPYGEVLFTTAAGGIALLLTWKLTRRLRQPGRFVRPRTQLRPHGGSQYIDGVASSGPDLVVRLRVRTAPGQQAIVAAGDIISKEGIRHE